MSKEEKTLKRYYVDSEEVPEYVYAENSVEAVAQARAEVGVMLVDEQGNRIEED